MTSDVDGQYCFRGPNAASRAPDFTEGVQAIGGNEYSSVEAAFIGAWFRTEFFAVKQNEERNEALRRRERRQTLAISGDLGMFLWV